MLAYARQIAPPGLPLEFVLADATVHPFDPGVFDLLVSRFGVMFFADPTLSFANMRRALRPARFRRSVPRLRPLRAARWRGGGSPLR